MSHIGEKIKKARRGRGISQAILAEKIGVSARRISHWETNNRKITAEILREIAKALGKKMEFFFDC